MVLFAETRFVRSTMAFVMMLLELVVIEDPKRASKASLWSAGVLPPHALCSSVPEVDLLRVIGVFGNVTVSVCSMI